MTRSKIAPDDYFEPREDLVIENIDGEFLILDVIHNAYFGLNPLGKLIWDALSEHKPYKEIVATLLQAYEVSEDVIESDTTDFLSQLLDAGLIRRVDGTHEI